MLILVTAMTSRTSKAGQGRFMQPSKARTISRTVAYPSRKVCFLTQPRLAEAERREVYKWLEAIDPSSLHHRACDQYEAGTGDWVLRSDDWKAWISGQKRGLWVHGIPGAGKTVLASHLIETVKAHCKDDSV